MIASAFALAGLGAAQETQMRPAVRFMAIHDLLRSVDCVVHHVLVACGTEVMARAATKLCSKNWLIQFGLSMAMSAVAWSAMDCKRRHGSWTKLMCSLVRARPRLKQ